jgi:hypothetical protein
MKQIQFYTIFYHMQYISTPDIECVKNISADHSAKKLAQKIERDQSVRRDNSFSTQLLRAKIMTQHHS